MSRASSHSSSRSSRSSQPTASRRSSGHHRRRSSRLIRAARWLGGNAAFVLLAASVFLVLAVIGLAARGPAQASGSTPAASGPQWIALKSQAPGDILAAVRQSPLFTVNRSDNGDHLKDLSRVGVPQLVTELRLTPGSQGADCYAVPILDASGATVGVAVAWLNPAHTAIYVGYIRSYDVPLARWTGTLPSADQAVAIVRTQHHTGLRAHTHPQLVYFPFDFQGQQTGRVHWTAGGEGPDTPIWLVPGADGHDHLVGTDGRAYSVSELPVSPLAR